MKTLKSPEEIAFDIVDNWDDGSLAWESVSPQDLRQAIAEAIEREREDAEKDYKDMRRMQAEFMRVDHELRELKERIERERAARVPSEEEAREAWLKWRPDLSKEINNATFLGFMACYDWLRDNIQANTERPEVHSPSAPEVSDDGK